MARYWLNADNELHHLLKSKGAYLAMSDRALKNGSIDVEDFAVIIQYTGMYAGTAVRSMGSFSNSSSGMNPAMQIGRYCSIASGLVFGGTRHPVEWATTSDISRRTPGALAQQFQTDD